MTPAASATLGRREFALIAILWALLACAFVFINRDSIAAMTLPDADDYLRLQQVRDWLAGQGWLDITQHRVNPPTGGLLHWSRVVDLPIAAGIALLTPLVGQPMAETITLVALPIIVMGLAMLLAGAIAARLPGRVWAPVAAICIPFSSIIYPQVMPLRIDHHGWQLVLALTLLWALTDETNKRRSGIVAGLAAAFWLNISLEGLPVITCAALILGMRWLFDARELPRLKTYLWTLTLASFALETTTMPSAWILAECDRISQPYLATFAVASLAAATASWPRLASNWRWRAGFAALTGAVAGAVFASIGPACLSGPFAALDPLTTTLWLDRVGESKPLLERGLGAFIANGGFAGLGCIGAGIAATLSRGEQRLRWLTVFTLTIAASALMLAISRTGAVAHGFAAAGAAFLGMTLWQRARAINITVVRVLGTVFALAIATPVLMLPALKLDLKPGVQRRTCATSYTSLATLPPSLIFSPIDIGPRIVVQSPHSVVATGHHRNHAAMHDLIATFAGSSDFARAQITARRAAYVVVCPGAAEVRNYARVAPDGFAAQLLSDRAPTWLRRVGGNGELLVFAVDTNTPGDDLRGRLALSTASDTRS
ncbi:MAG: hypothetical protein R3C27_06300 [Hyphomonadaceae bacterium]